MMPNESRSHILEASRLPPTVRAPRLERAFVRALLERAGFRVYLSTGAVYAHYEATKTMWALRDWFRRHRPDLRLEVRFEPVDGGWRLWARAEPRAPGNPAEIAKTGSPERGGQL